MRARAALLSLTALLAGAPTAHAFVLPDAKLDKPAITVRSDLFAQSIKLHACLVKAAVSCDKAEQPYSRQCYFTGNQAAPTTMFLGTDPKGLGLGEKFELAVQKCLAKVDFAKKGSRDTTQDQRYAAIGCPGDCSRPSGSTICSGMADYQESVTVRVLDDASMLAGLPGAAINSDPADVGACRPRTSPDPKIGAQQEAALEKCVLKVHAAVVKYVASLQKCQAACEKDYTGKKGGGGPVDGPPSCSTLATTLDPADPFAVCVAQATDKLNETPMSVIMTGQLTYLRERLDNQVNAHFNAPSQCVAPPA